jgi:hypothetical protein
MNGLDPNLESLAAAHRKTIDTPPLRDDSAERVRQATAEAETLLASAAELLSNAGYPSHVLYRVNWIGRAVYAGRGWDVSTFVLTETGEAHFRVYGGDSWHKARERYPRMLDLAKGEDFSQLGDLIDVRAERELEHIFAVLAATSDGRVEINYDTYDRGWMLLSDWLNDTLASLLRR